MGLRRTCPETRIRCLDDILADVPVPVVLHFSTHPFYICHSGNAAWGNEKRLQGASVPLALSLHRLSTHRSSPTHAVSPGWWAWVSPHGGDSPAPQSLALPLSLGVGGGVFECAEIKPEMWTLWKEAGEFSLTQEAVVWLWVRTIIPRAAPVLRGWLVLCEQRSG